MEGEKIMPDMDNQKPSSEEGFKEILGEDEGALEAFALGEDKISREQEEEIAREKRAMELSESIKIETDKTDKNKELSVLKHYEETVDGILNKAKEEIRKDKDMGGTLSEIEWVRVDAIMADIMSTKKQSMEGTWRARFNTLYSEENVDGMEKFKNNIRNDLISRTKKRALEDMSSGKTFH